MNEITRKVKVKSAVIELLSELLSRLDTRESDCKKEYVNTGETEEYEDWKTHEIMERPKWEYRDKTVLSEEEELKLEAIDTVRKALEKLI